VSLGVVCESTNGGIRKGSPVQAAAALLVFFGLVLGLALFFFVLLMRLSGCCCGTDDAPLARYGSFW